jgi:hypothetical protein
VLLVLLAQLALKVFKDPQVLQVQLARQVHPLQVLQVQLVLLAQQVLLAHKEI